MFSGDVTIAMYWRRPSAVGPMSTSFMRSDSDGQLLPVGFELGVVGDLIVVADVEAERLLGSGDLGRGLRVEDDQADRTAARARVRRCVGRDFMSESLLRGM